MSVQSAWARKSDTEPCLPVILAAKQCLRPTRSVTWRVWFLQLFHKKVTIWSKRLFFLIYTISFIISIAIVLPFVPYMIPHRCDIFFTGLLLKFIVRKLFLTVVSTQSMILNFFAKPVSQSESAIFSAIGYPANHKRLRSVDAILTRKRNSSKIKMPIWANVRYLRVVYMFRSQDWSIYHDIPGPEKKNL